MAFLEDLGRSNALGGVNRVLEKAIDLRQVENQEANQALGRAIDLEQLGIAKAASDREATKFKWQEKEVKAKEAIADMPVPLTSMFGVGWEKDPAKKMQFDKMKEKGLVEEVVPGVIMTTNRNAQALKEYGKQDLEWTKQVNEQNMVSINNQITQVGAALAGDKEATKALGINKPEELEQKKVELEKKLAGYVAAHKRIDIEHQNKIELEKTKAEGRIEGIKEGANIRAESSKYVADKTIRERERHNIQMEKIKKITAIKTGGGKPTALIQNTNFLVENGWDKQEAIKLLSSSKPMSRESFIGQHTLKVMNNDMIVDSEERTNRITEGISIYDEVIGKKANSPTSLKVLDSDMAKKILDEVGGDKDKARKIAKERKFKF